MSTVFDRLAEVIEARKQNANPDSSYVASLHAKGLNKILEKVGEEAVEAILAARDVQAGGTPQALINETADLWFHTLIMLSHLDITPAAVLAELERRQGVSGIDEKASRKS